MKGTEKQIKWAEEIKAQYIDMMDQAKEYLQKRIENEGSALADDETPTTALTFLNIYHPTSTYEAVYKEMKAGELFQSFMKAKRGTPEKKEAGKAYRTAVCIEALKRVEEAAAERMANDDAAYWIENRMH